MKTIKSIKQKYEQLTTVQKEIFRGYGLRQIKHFVEFSLPKIERCLPESAIVLGLNLEGKLQAENPITHEMYVWISDQQWKKSQIQSNHIDLTQDFIQIWKTFDLAGQNLVQLSHIHRDFLSA